MPIQIDVRDLLGHPGSARSVLVDQPVGDLTMELARVDDDRPPHAELLLESVVEGILVSGPIEGVMVLECARCLKPFDDRFHVNVQELFVAGTAPSDDEYPIDDGFVDVEPMMRDAVALAMPFAPLCRADCLGLCDRCGGDRNLGECRCAPEADARWSALLTLELPDERLSS